MVLRHAGESRQEQRVRQVVVRREDDALQVHRAGDEDQAGEGDAEALQPVGERRAAGRAVAFAGEVDRRVPALVLAEPGAHHLGQRLDVAVDAEQLVARLLARGDRVAGVRRVDEDQVEVLEPGVRVVAHRVGRQRHRAVVVDLHPLRAERAEVQPHRGRARPAVEGEADRAPARLGALERIRRREHRRFGLAAGIGEHRAGDRDELERHRIRHRLAAEPDLALAPDGGPGEELFDQLSPPLLGVLGGWRRGAGRRRVRWCRSSAYSAERRPAPGHSVERDSPGFD